MNKTGYIYSLTCNNPNLIYYGSTTKPLNERLKGHKTKSNNCESKILFEWGNVKINMLEEIKFEYKKELLERESYYIKNLKCVNKVIPYKTDKELEEYQKQYRINNKDILNERKRISYIKNKDKINEKKKKYRLENKDKIKEYNNERYKIKITCKCGSEIIKSLYSRHCKSKKHLQYIEESNINLVV